MGELKNLIDEKIDDIRTHGKLPFIAGKNALSMLMALWMNTVL